MWFSENYFINKGFISLVFLILLFLLRYFITRLIRDSNKPWTSEQRLRWIGLARSLSVGIILFGLVFIWGEQLHNFAVSIFAIAFAIVFSIKELCMCINGSVARLRGNLYHFGDRIEIDGVRGEVIDVNSLSTTLLETGPGKNGHHHTGRLISFPNSMVLSNFVVNESLVDHFYLHNIKIPMHLDEDWNTARKVLLKVAQEECSPYIEQARKRMREVARQKSIEFPSVEPRVIVQLPEPKQIHLILRVPSPVHLKGRLEQTILTRFLERMYAKDNLPEEDPKIIE